MTRAHIRAAAAVLVIAAAVAIHVTSASALPPPGDGGPIERPVTTRPMPPTTTPSTTTRVLQSLQVTTDSVVATATIRYDGTSPGTVTVAWGDGTSSGHNPDPRVESPWDSAGVVRLQHVYAAPTDGAAFPVAITAQLAGESQTVAVVVTPRYRVTQGPAVFSAPYACDSGVELRTEWRVQRSGGASPDRTWELNRFNNTIPPEALPDSTISVDVNGDAQVVLTYVTTELDPLVDNLGGSKKLVLSPRLGSRSANLHWVDFELSCAADLDVDISVALLTPGFGGGGPIGGGGGGPINSQ